MGGSCLKETNAVYDSGMRPAMNRIRPENWLDTFGLLIELIGLVALIGLAAKLISIIQSEGDPWPWSILASIGSMVLSLIGHFIRRIAKHQPLFDR
jgi:hypothetical protein